MIYVLFPFLLAIVKSTNNNNEIAPYNNLRKDNSKINLLINPNSVNITIINITFEDREINLYVNPESEIQTNLTFLITLYIDKYDDYLGYWLSKEIEVKASDYNGIGVFSAYIEDLTFENLTYDLNLVILNITIDNSNVNITYNVNYDQLVFNFPEENSIDVVNDLSPPDFDNGDFYGPITSDNSESYTNSEGNESSGSISIGIIIGIIAGVIVIIGAIITTICLCRKKNNNNIKNNESFQSALKEIIPDKTDNYIFNGEQKTNNIIKLSFETQNQKIKIEFVINGDCSLEEMRDQFFKKINRMDLIKDKDIYFVYGGNGFPMNKKGLVKNYFKQSGNDNRIIVIDIEDKMEEKNSGNNSGNSR